MSDQRDEFTELVKAVAQECVSILIEHKAVKRPRLFRRLLLVQTKNVRRSWGGLTRKQRGKAQRPRITIAKWYADATGPFQEYASIADDPEIGSFDSDENIHHVRAIVAHEIAHATDHWDGDMTGHGSEWRYRYRLLRRAFGLTESQRRATGSSSKED